jgi:hypothetical protein
MVPPRAQHCVHDNARPPKARALGPGWTVTQPLPGYDQWITPAGRTYTSEPYQYPI